MFEILENMFVMLGEYNPNDEYICHNTKQTDEISENFYGNMNLFVEYEKIMWSPNRFQMKV